MTAVLAVLTLAVAGVTHAATVLMLPWQSHRDAFARVAALGPMGTRITVPDAGSAHDPLPFTDPAFVTAVCRYDLKVQPFRIAAAPIEDGFVTLGFHSRHGIAFYGLTRRAGDADPLVLRLVEPSGGRPAVADLDAHEITIETPEAEGFVSLATPLAGDATEAHERLARFGCGSDAPR